MCDFSFSRKSLWEIRFNSSLTDNDNVSNLGGRSALRKGDPPSVWPSLCELPNNLAFHPQSLASKAAFALGTHHHPLSAQTSFDSSWSQSFSLKDWKGEMKLLRPLAALAEDPGSIPAFTWRLTTICHSLKSLVDGRCHFQIFHPSIFVYLNLLNLSLNVLFACVDDCTIVSENLTPSSAVWSSSMRLYPRLLHKNPLTLSSSG